MLNLIQTSMYTMSLLISPAQNFDTFFLKHLKYFYPKRSFKSDIHLTTVNLSYRSEGGRPQNTINFVRIDTLHASSISHDISFHIRVRRKLYRQIIYVGQIEGWETSNSLDVPPLQKDRLPRLNFNNHEKWASVPFHNTLPSYKQSSSPINIDVPTNTF